MSQASRKRKSSGVCDEQRPTRCVCIAARDRLVEALIPLIASNSSLSLLILSQHNPKALLRATLHYCIEFAISFTLFFFDLVKFMYQVLVMTQEKFEKFGTCTLHVILCTHYSLSLPTQTDIMWAYQVDVSNK